MANNFYNNEDEIAKYFIKLAPDFSIFDLAEKQMSETDDTDKYPLYYYKSENTSKIETDFRRAMFRMEGNITISGIDKETDFSCYTKYNGLTNQTIFICISSTDKPISFSLNSETSPIIGVCF